jgi:3',5'-cyclic AMP phosphodiesterase CpdA
MLIAQISDLHLKSDQAFAYDVADTADALRRTVDHLNHMVSDPDVVLITGDISDDGSRQSYDLARKLLFDLKAPFYLIPGNHDQKKHLLEAFNFHRYLLEGVSGKEGNYLCYAIDDYPVRLIGIDTVTPGLHGGGIGPNRLKWLDDTLSKRANIPTLVFMHHPPFASGIGHMDREVFHGREQLREVICRHPQVQRITCGHIHRAITCGFGGTVATVCPGVGMQLALDLRAEAPSGFKLEPAGVMVHCFERLWDDTAVMITHTSIVEDKSGQWGKFHPFFNVVSPK